MERTDEPRPAEPDRADERRPDEPDRETTIRAASPATIRAPGAGVRVSEATQTMLTALTLAFVFRAFFIEAFIIPTGSMAGGLLGQHGQMVCPACGWMFAFAPSVYAADDQFVPPVSIVCPNCHTDTPTQAAAFWPGEGDRVLVAKWSSDLGGWFGIDRWDVVVFRDPLIPDQNYIKRVVALPGETVEIIDGDVYVAEAGGPLRIARKPEWAQQSLWTIVYSQNYPPVDAGRDPARRAPWVAGDDPAAPAAGSGGWSGLAERVLRYAPGDGGQAVLRFAPRDRRDLRDACAYNFSAALNNVRDVRIAAEVCIEPASQPGADGVPAVSIELRCDGQTFTAALARSGVVSLRHRRDGGPAATLGETGSARVSPGQPVRFELRHVDYCASVWVGGRRVLATTDTQYHPEPAAARALVRSEPVQIALRGYAAPLTVHNLSIERDVYYTHSYKSLRATDGRPFHLESGEYFVLGDNSAASHDSREWSSAGPHLAGRDPPYRLGTVPRDQIVGRAVFVYLPGLAPVGPGGGWSLPDLRRLRFVR